MTYLQTYSLTARTSQNGANRYMFGFNGMERDNEVKGVGNSLDFGARIYDSRLGQFLSKDPMLFSYPFWSTYIFAANNPVVMIDYYGWGPLDRVKKARSMLGKPYAQETGALRTEETKEALAFMDCSEFVTRVLVADGIVEKGTSMDSKEIKALVQDKTKFVHSNVPQVGDIAVWDGHVGIVTAVDPKTGKFKLAHARGKEKLSLENPHFTTAAVYKSSTFYGFYRPIQETSDAQIEEPQQSQGTPYSEHSASGDYIDDWGERMTQMYARMGGYVWEQWSNWNFEDVTSPSVDNENNATVDNVDNETEKCDD